MENINERIKGLIKEYTSLKGKYKDLVNEKENIELENMQIQETLENKEKIVTDLNLKIEMLNNDLLLKNQSYENLKKENEALKNDLKSNDEQNEELSKLLDEISDI